MGHWCIYPKPALEAQRFAKQLGCPTGNSDEMVKCFKDLDAMTLEAIQLEITVRKSGFTIMQRFL
jgi:hypothetical protein